MTLLAGMTVRSAPDREFVFPPLTFGAMRRLKEAGVLAALDSKEPATVEQAAMDILHAAISRNYPSVSMVDLEEIVDVQNGIGLVRYVIGSARLPEAKPGEAGSP